MEDYRENLRHHKTCDLAICSSIASPKMLPLKMKVEQVVELLKKSFVGLCRFVFFPDILYNRCIYKEINTILFYATNMMLYVFINYHGTYRGV